MTRAIFDKTLSERDLCDVELILNGGFAPVEGFLNADDYASVLETMRLANGKLWPMPLSLLLTQEERRAMGAADEIALRDAEGGLVALLQIETVEPFEARRQAQAVFGAEDGAHPYVRHLLARDGDWRVGGRLVAVNGARRRDFAHLRRGPSETRAMLKRAGWSKVVAFQTRNPMHRSHYHLTLLALEQAGPDAGLLLHPTVGPTQPGDVPANLRVAAYERIFHRYPAGRAALALLPLAMRMGGPREAVWHAIIRRNHGATHFIVGRDHAGPSAKRADGQPFFDPYAAQALLSEHAAEIGVEPIFSQEIAYYPELDAHLPVDKAPSGLEAQALSGSKQRELLAAGEPLPHWFTFPEIAALLADGFGATRAA